MKNKLYASFIAVAMLAVITGGIGYQQIQLVQDEMDISSQLFEIRELGTSETKMVFELSACVNDYISYEEGAKGLRSTFTSKLAFEPYHLHN